MADDDLMGQDDIERLLQQAKGGSTEDDSAGTVPEPSAPAASDDGNLDQSEIESLFGGAASPSGEPAAAPASAPPAAASEEPDMADGDRLLGQDDIEQLLNQAGRGGSPAVDTSPPSSPTVAAEPSPPETCVGMAQSDLEYLLDQAEEALQSIDGETGELPPGMAEFQYQEFGGAPASTENATLDLIRDVELDLRIELGRTHMYLDDILRLRKGSVVPLDKLAGDPVDIYVNGRLIARGEVLVLNDNFCVRVAELIAGTGVPV